MNEQNKNEQDKERNWERDWDQEKTSAEKTSASLDDDAESLSEKE
jgi:hypothetical protein